MTFEDPELLAEFVTESQEHLEEVENELLTLELQKGDMDLALVNKVFRAVHSIKGAAGFLGQQTLETLAHREEEVLNRLRNNQMRPTRKVVSTLLAATDRLKSLLENIESSNEQDVSDHVIALEALLSGDEEESLQEEQRESLDEAPVASDRGAVSADAMAISRAMTETCESDSTGERERNEKEKALRPQTGSGTASESLREFLVESFDNLEQIDQDLLSLERDPLDADLLNGIFRSVHTLKGSAGFLAFKNLEQLAHAAESLLGKARSKEVVMTQELCSLLFSTVDIMQKHLEAIACGGQEGQHIPGDLIRQLQLASEGKATEPEQASQSNAIVDQNPLKPNLPSKAAARSHDPIQKPKSDRAPTELAAKPVAESTIRVDVALLDNLMTRVGELVLARNQIMQFTSALADSELLNTSQRLNLITTELQEGVMKTRMQPIGNVWAKFPRIVRDLANTCGKEVRIEMLGKETELDKTIIEAIKDPLTHLVRNSVDHGIEAPQVRSQNGKSPEGCLQLRAFHEGGQVNIEISDDGAGLDPEKIKRKAKEKTLITQEQADRMQDHEVCQLIFLPGFSTAEKISNVSGRGVGMDVVKTNIEKIGGMVDIQSRLGHGTTIKIKIPLTLAIIPALTITNEGNRFAIPQVNLLELVRLDGGQQRDGIEWIQGAPVYRLRGRLLPLVYLRKLLQTDSAKEDSGEAISIVVLRADDRQFGLVVDQINDTEEIVVKPLSKQLKGITVYSGTTIMGDGKVALILDVLGLAHASNLMSRERDRGPAENASQNSDCSSNRQSLLILGTGDRQRLALPISQVARLEKISKASVELANNQEVVQYRNEILPLIRLADVLGQARQAETSDPQLNVVVYTEQSVSVGLVVDRVIDIVETTLEISCVSRSQGLLGSAVIQDCVTDVLDLPAVIKRIELSS